MFPLVNCSKTTMLKWNNSELALVMGLQMIWAQEFLGIKNVFDNLLKHLFGEREMMEVQKDMEGQGHNNKHGYEKGMELKPTHL